MRQSAFEREAETFCERVSRALYRQRAGLEETLDLASLYGDVRRLFTPETHAALQEEVRDPAQRRFLLEFVARGYLAAAAGALRERLLAAVAAETLVWDDRPLPYRAAPAVRDAEPSAARRHELDERWRRATARLSPLAAQRLAELRRRACDFGAADLAAFWDAQSGLGLEALGDQAARLLAATAGLYQAALADALGAHGLPGDGAWRADLGFVFRAARFDRWFTSERRAAVLHATARDLGVDLAAQPNVRLDLEPRPTKSPRPFCAAVRVPDELYLVVRPRGGRPDYAALLRLLGLAESYAHRGATLPFAYRRLGDAAALEAYGLLLEGLLRDPVWLRRHLALGDAADYLRLAHLELLYRLRRAATLLQYEQEVYRADEVEACADRYVELFGANLGVRHFPEEYLAEVSDDLRSARTLRAHALAAQLRTFLAEEFDPEWFRHPRAARFLRDRWREGNRYTADELARHLGFDRLELAPLQGEVLAALRS